MADVFENELIDMTLHLDEGVVCCEFCQGDYSHELEVVCDACKRALCPFCATRVNAAYSCPKCSAARNRAEAPRPLT